jgi:hypothetical protein
MVPHAERTCANEYVKDVMTDLRSGNAIENRETPLLVTTSTIHTE